MAGLVGAAGIGVQEIVKHQFVSPLPQLIGLLTIGVGATLLGLVFQRPVDFYTPSKLRQLWRNPITGLVYLSYLTPLIAVGGFALLRMETLTSFSNYSLLLGQLGIAVVAALMSELLYRWVVLSELVHGIRESASIFVAAGVAQVVSLLLAPVIVVPVLITELGLNYLYLRTQSLVATMVAHVILDSSLVVLGVVFL